MGYVTQELNAENVSLGEITGAVDISELCDRPRVIHATFTGNVTFTLGTPSSLIGFRVTLVITQDGTGSRTLTLPATVKYAGGTNTVLSTSAADIDVVHLDWLGDVWVATAVLDIAV